MEKKTLEFASLLHDIGKFYQRTETKHDDKFSNADFGQNGAHAKWSADFIDKYLDNNILNLALHHHNPNKSNNPELCAMLQKADHHSSVERICSTENNVKASPLISIFSEIKLEENDVPQEYRLPLTELDLNHDFEDIRPKSNDKELMSGWNLVPEYKVLWKKFNKEIINLKHLDFNTILALLRKYASNIPSAVFTSKPDISLFDHLKTTSALATCRYLYKRDSSDKLHKTTDNQKVYLAINGDISGIQDFIFKISSPQEAQSGMSKRLRGRSLYLTLLTDAISTHIANELELTQANILFCGGGRFTIIAPNTDNSKEKLSKIKKMVNKEFITKFNAELYLSLVYEECSGKDEDENASTLAEFGRVTRKLNNKLVEDKKHKFVENLNDVFNQKDKIIYEDICSVCGKLYNKIDEDDFTCKRCKSHEKLGQDVANSNYLLKCHINSNYDFKDASKDFSFYDKNLNIGYSFMRLKESASKIISKIDKLDMFVDKFEIIKLNDTNFLEFVNEFDELTNEKISFSFSFLGNTVPRYSNKTPLYFEHLAQLSKGANKLGVLKMDVDNLGLIFSNGFNHLKNDEDGGMSISRVATLSSQLDLFFSGFVNNLASNYKVYSEVNDLSDKFDSKILKLQNEEETEFTIYKKKYDVKLSENEEKSLEKYAIPTIYINYSGGDDLLVLGPYDDVICFAQELRETFKKWTANNDSINLSAGISIISPKFPIGKAVDMAEEYLETSKSCGKDKITVFGEVVDWRDDGTSKIKGFNTLFDFAEKLEEYNFNNKVSSGIIYSMLQLWQNSNKKSLEMPYDKDGWDDSNHRKISSKRSIPLFKYKLRLIKDKDVRNYLDENGVKLMPWIKIPVSWVSLRMRQ